MASQKYFFVILTTFLINFVQISRANEYDGTPDNQIILSRQKRDFGGSEPIDYAKAIAGVFGPAGIVVHGCEAFSDIIFHLTGYTVLGNSIFISTSHQGHSLHETSLPRPHYLLFYTQTNGQNLR